MAFAIDKQASTQKDLALLIGRILVGVLFLIAAYNKFKGYDGAIGYFTRLGVPAPSVTLPLVLIIETVGGLMLIVGFQARLAALLLAVFVIVAALSAHMNFGDGNQLNHFLKNIAIAGGLLAFFVTGPGAYSLDARK